METSQPPTVDNNEVKPLWIEEETECLIDQIPQPPTFRSSTSQPPQPLTLRSLTSQLPQPPTLRSLTSQPSTPQPPTISNNKVRILWTDEQTEFLIDQRMSRNDEF